MFHIKEALGMGDKIEIMDLKQDKIALEKELQNLVYGSV